MSGETSPRRRFLKLGSVALTTVFAGCNTALSAPDSEPSSPGSTTARPTDDRTERSGVYARGYRETVSSVVLVQTGNR